MSVTTTLINRVERVCDLIKKNAANSVSSGPWFMSHGHVISPGIARPKLPNGTVTHVPGTEFDVCSTPYGKAHAVYRHNLAMDGGRGDMRYIATVEPYRMTKLVEDVEHLIHERNDITALAARLDDLINNTLGGNEEPRAGLLGEAIEKYLTSAT